MGKRTIHPRPTMGVEEIMADSEDEADAAEREQEAWPGGKKKKKMNKQLKRKADTAPKDSAGSEKRRKSSLVEIREKCQSATKTAGWRSSWR